MKVLEVRQVAGRGTVAIVEGYKDGLVPVGVYVHQGGHSWRVTGLETARTLCDPPGVASIAGLFLQVNEGDGVPEVGVNLCL